ncbi:hydrogenase maturation protease [Nocardioides salsibiostraticola]
MAPAVQQPYELLDDGFAPEPCELLVIGCGNILRGDDAVGPILVRHLHERGIPDGVRVVDGGTSGMDVAFGMRGAERVVIVDAASTENPAGTVYRVPAEHLAELPPIDGLHTHNFRWNHAISFSSWLLGPLRPTDVTVFLVEAEQLEPGTELSTPVAQGMQQVLELIVSEFFPAAPTVEITEDGYLHVPAALAARWFPQDVCVARMEGPDLDLVPLAGSGYGGLVLKQCNAAGDRSLLVSEVFAFAPAIGRFPVRWDEASGSLRVLVGEPTGGAQADGVRGPDRGRAGIGPVDGVSDRAQPRGDRSSTAAQLPDRAAGPPGRGRDSSYRGET